MTVRWTFGHYPPGKFPLLAFPTPPQRKAAEQRVTDKRWAERGVLGEGRKWWRQKETDTSPVSNQRSCGAQFKAGMGQTSKLLEFCHLSLPPPTFSKERKKEKRGGRAEGRKELNENQTHSPVWSGCEQWGGWCHKSEVGFSPYLFIHFTNSPSTSVGPLSYFSCSEILKTKETWFKE